MLVPLLTIRSCDQALPPHVAREGGTGCAVSIAVGSHQRAESLTRLSWPPGVSTAGRTFQIRRRYQRPVPVTGHTGIAAGACTFGQDRRWFGAWGTSIDADSSRAPGGTNCTLTDET